MNRTRRYELKQAIAVGLVLLLGAFSAVVAQMTVAEDVALGLAENRHEDFEVGWGDFSPDNGVWEVGIPTSGPGKAHQGLSAAATILAGTTE